MIPARREQLPRRAGNAAAAGEDLAAWVQLSKSVRRLHAGRSGTGFRLAMTLRSAAGPYTGAAQTSPVQIIPATKRSARCLTFSGYPIWRKAVSISPYALNGRACATDVAIGYLRTRTTPSAKARSISSSALAPQLDRCRSGSHFVASRAAIFSPFPRSTMTGRASVATPRMNA